MAEVQVAPANVAAASGSEPWPSPARAWYAVAIFGATVFTLFGTQFLISLILSAIKADLNLSENQLAIIFGSAGFLVLAFASFVVSPLADFFSRRLIIGLGLLILGLCNLSTAMVTAAGVLLVVRLIGGFGGAGNGPATFSLLADTFPPAKLPKAMAAMNIGFMFALGLAYLVGGYLMRSLATPTYTLPFFGELRSWQVVFLILAIPDLILGFLVMFTVLEPKRRRPAGTAAPTLASAFSYGQVFKYLWDNRRTFAPMYVGLLLDCIALGANTFWMAVFYQRTHGWGPGDFGVYQGWVLLLLAPAGLLFGGWLAERLAKRGIADANQRVVIWAGLAHLPFATLFALMPSPWMALAFASLNTCIIAIGTGPRNAAFQSIVPNEMRAKITATFLFMFTIGQAIGPVFVSSLTTNVFGDDNIRYSLALSHGVLGPLAILITWMGLRAYGEAYSRATAWQK
jgi:MFS family permease